MMFIIWEYDNQQCLPDLQEFFQLIPPPIELCFEIIKSLRWYLIQLPWESGRAMRKIIFCGKRWIRIIVVADWLDNRHMPPLQVLDSTLYLQKFKIGVSCIIVSNYFLFSPVLSVIICWRVVRFFVSSALTLRAHLLIGVWRKWIVQYFERIISPLSSSHNSYWTWHENLSIAQVCGMAGAEGEASLASSGSRRPSCPPCSSCLESLSRPAAAAARPDQGVHSGSVGTATSELVREQSWEGKKMPEAPTVPNMVAQSMGRILRDSTHTKYMVEFVMTMWENLSKINQKR